MKILYTTTIGLTMPFFRTIVQELIEQGNQVDIATNENHGGTPVYDYFREMGCEVYQMPWSRTVIDTNNIRSIKQIAKITKLGGYDIVHCHTPIASICTRIGCKSLRKQGLKVIYTAHGFHFFRGASLKSWILYYFPEYLCSFWTDTLITITKEDYARAKKRFHAKKTIYVPGVGIDTAQFQNHNNEKVGVKERIGLSGSDRYILSVGELNENKNHINAIKAFKNIYTDDLHYCIAGVGVLKEKIQNVIDELQLTKNVHLLGFRKDMDDLYAGAELVIHPSFREGLSVTIMEAIASKCIVICSNIRGNRDLVSFDCLFDPKDINDISRAINYGLNLPDEKKHIMYTEYARLIPEIDYKTINKSMMRIYTSCVEK